MHPTRSEFLAASFPKICLLISVTSCCFTFFASKSRNSNTSWCLEGSDVELGGSKIVSS